MKSDLQDVDKNCLQPSAVSAAHTGKTRSVQVDEDDEVLRVAMERFVVGGARRLASRRHSGFSGRKRKRKSLLVTGAPRGTYWSSPRLRGSGCRRRRRPLLSLSLYFALQVFASLSLLPQRVAAHCPRPAVVHPGMASAQPPTQTHSGFSPRNANRRLASIPERSRRATSRTGI